MNFRKEVMGHGHPFVNLQDIFGKNVVDVFNLGLAESSEKQRKEYSLNKGDVLFIRSSVKPEGVGETALVPQDFPDTTYSGFIIRFRPNVQMDDEFKRFAFSTKHIRNQIMAHATSSANTNINQESLQKIQVKLPYIEEQAKIGSFFANLDDTLALHQEKRDKLRRLKKAFLQLMFPQNGKTVPPLRFANFESSWEQRKLGELMTFSNGVNATKESYGHGTKMISVMDVLSDGRLTHDKIRNSVSLSTKSEDSNKVENGDLVFVRSSETPVEAGWAKAYLSKEPVVFSGFTIRGKKVANFNALFIEIFLNSKGRRQLDRKASGSTHFNIGQAQLNSTIAIMPSLLEQGYIASLFEKLENTIALHHEQIDKLKKLKNAYLKMMFI